MDAAAVAPGAKLCALYSLQRRESWIVDLDRGRIIRRLQGHAHGVWQAAWRPDGRAVATASDDWTARVWDLHAPIAPLVLRHPNVVTAVAWAREGNLVATGCADGNVRVWSIPMGQETALIHGLIGGASTVAFSPDGTRLAIGGLDGTVAIWDRTRRRLVAATVPYRPR
jgi:WD40 repeat protein